MAELQRRRFFYKLCLIIKGNTYCFSQKNILMNVGKSFTQDTDNPLPYLFVYMSPDLALTSEITCTPKGSFISHSKKTIIKLMCWGSHQEICGKFAYSNMCVVEDVGIPKQFEIKKVKSRDSSRVRKYPRFLSNPRQKSPQTYQKMTIPLRIYSSGLRPKKSQPKPDLKPPIVKRPNIHRLLFKMKQETDKLDQEVRDIEYFNKLLELEDMDELDSSEA